MLKPYDFDFSHPALRKCFSIDLVKKIREFIKAYKDFLDLLLEFENEFDKYFGDINVYYAVKNYVDYSLSGVADMSSRNWEYFFQHYSMKRRCENCGMLLSKNSPVNKAHIIKRSFFKSRGTKLYKDTGFEHHMANTLILCANCHDKIERKGMRPSKRLLNRRTKLKDRMLNDIKEDIRFIRETMKEINMFRFELESYKIELEKELRQKMAERIKEWLNTFT